MILEPGCFSPHPKIRKWFGAIQPSSLIIPGTVLLLSLGLYLGTLWYAPIWDDHGNVLGEPFLADCRNLWVVLNPKLLVWNLPVKNAARPLWLASVILDTCFYQGVFAGYRATNMLLHGLGGILFLMLAWRLSGRTQVAVFAGLLFAANPLHTEPVNIITFRADLLAFLFMVAALLMYLHGRELRGRRRIAWMAASAIPYGLAMLSKEMAVVLPLLMLLAHLLFPQPRRPGPRRPPRRRYWGVYGLFSLVLLAFLCFRTPRSGYVTEGHMDFFSHLGRESSWLHANAAPEFLRFSKEAPLIAVPPRHPMYQNFSVRAWTASKVLGAQLRLLFWPHPLRGDYPSRAVRTWRDAGVWASWGGWLVLLVLAWKLRRRRPLITFSLLWIPLALLPVSGIVSLVNLRADRYLYIPSAGSCLFIAASLFELSRMRWRHAGMCATVLGVAITTVYGALTLSRNKDYRNEKAYYSSTLRVDPTVPRSHYNLGVVYQAEGSTARAEEEYREALRLWPEASHWRNQLAILLIRQGKAEEGIAELKTALRHDDDFALRLNLGRGYLELSQPAKALREFQTALRFNRESPRAAFFAGKALLELDRPREAIPLLRSALKLSRWRSPPALFQLISAYRKTGDQAAANRIQRLLRRTAPGFADALKNPASLR